MTRDPGRPVTYVAEVTYVESPGCPAGEYAANYSAVPNPQLLTKENSTFHDAQWFVGGRNRRPDVYGAVRPYSKYKVRLKRNVGEAEGQFSPVIDVFTAPSGTVFTLMLHPHKI
jgi:hypothetical protein